jgi:hypothetical protein
VDLFPAFVMTVEGFDVLFDGSEGKNRKHHLETKDPF